MGTSWLRKRTSARSSESRTNQKEQHAGFEQIPLREVDRNEHSGSEVKVRQTRAYGRDPTKAVGDPSNKLQTREVVHGNASLADGISGIEMVPLCSNLSRRWRLVRATRERTVRGLEIVGGAIRKTGRAEKYDNCHLPS